MTKKINNDQKRTIIFIYNADSGFLKATVGYVHKIVSPKTYQCNLCAVTFDNLGMNKEWKQFIKSLDVEVEFLHRDEFIAKYKKEGKFPSAFLKNKELELFISQDEMNALKNHHELIDLVKKKLEDLK